MRSPISLAAAATLFMLAVAVHSSAQGGAPQAQGRGGAGGGRATFPAQQRPPGDPVLIARGNGLYGVHCRACHGVDLRGGDQGGPNLLRSDLVLNDQAGELIAPVILNGQQRVGSMPPIRVTQDDARAIAEYIHSVTATMRGQGNPPPGPDAVLNVLVGDAAGGEMYFNAKCGACHSTTGDLRGIGSRLPDPTTLQNYWISGGGGLGRGGRGGRGRPIPVSVTSTPGQRVDGTLVRLDDFYVVVELADGTQRTFRRDGERPVVDVRDPLEPHRQLLPTYTDKDIHNVTAYLVTLK